MKNTQTELNCIQDDNSYPMSIYELRAEYHKVFNDEDEDEEELCSIRNGTYTNNNNINSTEEIELRSIIDNAPIAEFNWSSAYYNTFNDDELDSIKNGTYTNNNINSTEKNELRSIIDNAPIAEFSPSQSPFFNLSQDNENIVIENKKIFPFEVENLEEIYNKKRFPDRIRREARVLKKFNILTNYSIVTAFLLFKADTVIYKKPRLTHYANLAHQVIDAPMKSLKTKISQLDRWKYMEKNNQVSHGLIDAYHDISHINPQILWNIIKNHDKLDALEEIKKLIKKDKNV